MAASAAEDEEASPPEACPSLQQLAAQVQGQREMLLRALPDLGRILEKVTSMEEDHQQMRQEFAAVKLEVQANSSELKASIEEVKASNGEVKAMVGEVKAANEEQSLCRIGSIPELKEEENSNLTKKPKDCAEMFKDGVTQDGVYTIYPKETYCPLSSAPDSVQVYCDMSTQGGGWTVFLRRVDDKWNFPARNWSDYSMGFGSPNNSYWLGNNNIHCLTSSGSQRLRVDLKDWEGNTRYAEYSQFSVGSEDDNFRLSIGEYTGNAGDSLTYHNGYQFSTFDADHDNYSRRHCAAYFHGAWWYHDCHHSQLTGEYLQGAHSKVGQGVHWYHWRGNFYSYMQAEMKVRPANFPN